MAPADPGRRRAASLVVIVMSALSLVGWVLSVRHDANGPQLLTGWHLLPPAGLVVAMTVSAYAVGTIDGARRR